MQNRQDKLAKAVVGIAGLGGLGSVAAVALARANVGKLIVVDFDIVERANLNRQHYFINQVGRAKVDCMIENLKRINPAVCVEGHQITLGPDNIPDVFAEADVIVECLDRAEQKQMFIETVLRKMDQPVVSASGLAGYGDSNAIRTWRVNERLILVGDGETGIDQEPFLTAARVGIAACHQANAVLELILNDS